MMAVTELRASFRARLDQLTQTLVEMARLAGSAVERATRALLDADAELARTVVADDAALGALGLQAEETAIMLLALESPVAGDLRRVMASLRISSDLERAGDLAAHVAKVTLLRHPAQCVPADLCDIVREMGEVAERMVEKAGIALVTSDLRLASEIEGQDERMDTLHRRLFHILLAPDWSGGIEPAIDLVLLGRYYERFADHAVSVARQVGFLVTGEPLH
jgi:phosphate transport system protein